MTSSSSPSSSMGKSDWMLDGMLAKGPDALRAAAEVGSSRTWKVFSMYVQRIPVPAIQADQHLRLLLRYRYM